MHSTSLQAGISRDAAGAPGVAPCYAIGIDLGGTNLRIAAYSGETERLEVIALRTRLADGPHAVLRDMADAVKSLYQRCGVHGEFRGVGIGSPGPIELPAGKILAAANLPGWEKLSLKDELEKLLDMPVIVESDGNTAALAEFKLGAGRAFGVDSVAMFTLGTGVGGGIILDGRIWHGATGAAGEPGHTVTYPGGRACNCGSRGCLEVYASASAVRKFGEEAALAPGGERLRELFDAGSLQAESMADLARDGDAAAQAIFNRAGDALGIGVACWIGALNLSLYTVGGGLSQAWDLLAPALYRSIEANSQVFRLTKAADRDVFDPLRTNVCRAHLGSEAGLLGAALLPFAS